MLGGIRPHGFRVQGMRDIASQFEELWSECPTSVTLRDATRLSCWHVGHFLTNMSFLRLRRVTILQARTSRGLGSGFSAPAPLHFFQRIPYRKGQYDALSLVLFGIALHR